MFLLLVNWCESTAYGASVIWWGLGSGLSGVLWFCCAGLQQPGLVVVDADLLELKRGNLLLEREKLSLEIQILRAKLARKTLGDEVWTQESKSIKKKTPNRTLNSSDNPLPTEPLCGWTTQCSVWPSPQTLQTFWVQNPALMLKCLILWTTARVPL